MLKARHTEDTTIEVGIDEAGRGCLWGPLFAAAVVLPCEVEWSDELRAHASQIKDSKKITPKRRARLEQVIKDHVVAWGIGRVEAGEIDTLGMTRANRLAFTRALEDVEAKGTRPQRILIDGILGLPPVELNGREQHVEAGGDGTYLAIAAASILAKEGHDKAVRELCEAEATLHERYGLLNSKGYGTALHRAGILKHGMHGDHRRLFLRKLLNMDHVVHAENQYDFLDDS